MEVPRLGVELDPSHVCNLYHSSWQRRIFNPLSEARDQTHILMDTGWFHYPWATTGTPHIVNQLYFENFFLKEVIYGVPVVAPWLTNPTMNYEVSGSIPGLTQWVKDLVLP